MTSRRQRTRGDKRDRFTSEPSPELETVLSAISTGRCEDGGTACTDCESQGRCMVETLTLKTGETVDLKGPWRMPT